MGRRTVIRQVLIFAFVAALVLVSLYWHAFVMQDFEGLLWRRLP